MENHDKMITLEQFESDLKVLLEANSKHLEKNETDTNCTTLENQLKNETSATEEIVNDCTNSNCTSSSSLNEKEKHLETKSMLDNATTESVQKENEFNFNSHQTQKYTKKYLEYEKDEVKMIKNDILKCSNATSTGLLYIARGKDRGYRVFHYVLVDINKKETFLKKSKTGSMDVKDYGTILCSGWGENAPQHKIDKMKSFYSDIYQNLFIQKEISKTRSIYHYVLLDSKKLKEFEEQCNVESISIEKIQNYGKLLYSGYGTDPPEVIFLKMEQAFFYVNYFDFFFNFQNIFQKNIETLHLAIQNNDLETTASYIKQGYNLNEGDKNDWTSLHHGAHSGNLQIVKKLLENGANFHAIDNVCGRKPVHIAAKEGHLHIIKLLLISGNTVDDVDKNNWTPLHYAAWNGHLEIVTFLLGKRANIDITDFFNGKKAIHTAAREGHTEIVKVFLNCGMDIEDADKEGRTSLYYAAYLGRLSTAQFLINKSANINTENKFANKCIHVAARSGIIDIVKLFLNSGIDINTPNLYGSTPLHYAVTEGDIDMVVFLIEKGANVNAESEAGETPLDKAKENKNMEIANVLEAASASF